jgi:transmembrane sensor
MEENQPDYELIIRFIEGAASKEEAEKVLTWINSNKQNEALYFRIKDIIDYHAAQNRSIDIPAAWEKIVSLAKEEQPEPAVEMVPARRPGIRFPRYAAAILFVITGLALFYYYSSQSSPPGPLIIQVPEQEPVRLVVLPDSSKVWLKGGSELRYEAGFAQKERSVWLKGTGFFEVSKMKDGDHQPLQFVIHTSRTDVTVLGTSFTIDEDKESVSVIVNTGLVKATTKDREILLQPSDRLLIDSNKIRQDRVNAALFAAWKDGDYWFEKTSVHELKSVIETIYNYQVILHQPEKLKSKKITGRITVADETTLWNALSLLLQAKVIKRNNQIIIHPE